MQKFSGFKALFPRDPPYKKINSASEHRHILRRVRIETVNLYSAFVALSLVLMQPGASSWRSSRAVFATGHIIGPSENFC